jgi:hypothetical protein
MFQRLHIGRKTFTGGIGADKRMILLAEHKNFVLNQVGMISPVVLPKGRRPTACQKRFRAAS